MAPQPGTWMTPPLRLAPVHILFVPGHLLSRCSLLLYWRLEPGVLPDQRHFPRPEPFACGAGNIDPRHVAQLRVGLRRQQRFEHRHVPDLPRLALSAARASTHRAQLKTALTIAAQCAAEFPSASIASLSAPPASSACTTVVCPPTAAFCSAVTPSRFAALALAPPASSFSTTVVCP